MTKFTFTRAGGFTYLQTRPGCHVRVDLIAAVTVGTLVPDDREDTLFVYLQGGGFAAFDPSPSAQDAQGTALDLLDALHKVGD